MIMSLKGNLVEKQPTHVIVEVGGVGYGVLISLLTYGKLPSLGSECSLLIHDYLREDRHDLYGFASESEKKMFLMLIGINGVGPRLALSALSGLSIRELKAAILDGDTRRLTSISGLGKKTAERMIVEMRDRLDEGDALESTQSEEAPHDARIGDAVMALISLGYKQSDATRMVKKVVEKQTGDLEVEEIVRRSLSS
jgi:Holliday junction DNA helicase RuvA